MSNSLQAVLNRVKSETTEPDRKPEKKRQPAPKKVKSTKVQKTGRSHTVLIGGHFSPEVSKQLRIIAAEEGTTNQALLEQALNLLFTKKGKKRIAEL